MKSYKINIKNINKIINKHCHKNYIDIGDGEAYYQDKYECSICKGYWSYNRNIIKKHIEIKHKIKIKIKKSRT